MVGNDRELFTLPVIGRVNDPWSGAADTISVLRIERSNTFVATAAHRKNGNINVTRRPLMSMTQQPPQSVPLQMHQTDDRIVLAAPMPGLEPQGISVTVSGDKVTIHGEYRGPRQGKPDLLVSEWTAGPYHREVELPQPVDGGLTNASYGNGVLMLSMPKMGEGKGEERTQFQLEVVDATRGLRVGHTGSDIQPSTTQEHQQKVAEVRDDRS